MRGYIFLLILVLATAFSVGYVAIALRSSDPAKDATSLNPSDVLNIQMASVKPSFVVDLDSKFPASAMSTLMKPEYFLANYEQFSFAELEVINQWLDRCDFIATLKSQNPSITKLKIYEKWHCDKSKTLPNEFLESPPYIHPSGKSYAFLIRGHTQWSERFEHISERETWTDPSIYQDIQSWDLEEYLALTSGSPIVFGLKYIWYRTKNAQPKSDPVGQYSFSLYKIEDWEKIWKDEQTQPLKYQANLSCYGGAGYVCWSTNYTRLVWKTERGLIGVGILSVLLLFTTLTVFVRRISLDRAQRERQKFALQMLAHELRTPIASLKLTCENLRTQFDNFKADQQSLVLRVFDDVERLRRVAERSQAYLSSTDIKKKLEFRSVEVNSLKELFENIFDPYKGQIEWKVLGQDRKAHVDPYWLQVALKNIVENALVHGKSPVFATVTILAGGVSISVQDQGEKKFNPLIRGLESPGLGLGLGLVREIAVQSGGRLEIQYHPTRVTFDMKEKSS